MVEPATNIQHTSEQDEAEERFIQLKFEEDEYVTSMSQLKVTQKPKMAIACPYRVQLKKGHSYFYCTCGHSANQPFCDKKC
jgi:hypothetical protein